MPRIRRLLAPLLAFVLACTLAACVSTPPSAPPAATAARAPVLLVSIDGFRADYLDAGLAPNLSRIASEGVRAHWMNPSYPSLTFPNHYSIVTGLRPDHHGIVHNRMHDAALGDFSLSDREAVGDRRWWGGKPIWVTAQEAGLRSATMFWPGSEAAIGGVQPTQWRPFDKEVGSDARVDQVLAWLDAPPSTRPALVTLYFDIVDTAGHHDGPDSPQARAALAEVDAALGRLRAGLVARGLLDSVDLVIVSDHGMATVLPGHVVALEDMVTMAEAKVVSAGQVVGIAPNPGFEAAVEAKLLGAHERYDCWRKGELPARWHYGTHPRIPPIVCQMHEGWDALPREYIARRPDHARGSHGYDLALPSMRALFVARGPAFRQGAEIPAFDNVDVYPLLARLLGIAPAPNDGNIAPLLPALREAAP
ncbi:ectonucleotide pyrophosphatase/phosphodiesterase [Luteimonas mephitis]|uniref:alkaline phosphatase family protein n=1 Tax=Luteimonas mephitis TaxID=83615 RepID=UPI00047B9BD5|nr:ectonucleotide pyrophosphatase/phosphodiesterase [Luteimonas mephitis]